MWYIYKEWFVTSEWKNEQLNIDLGVSQGRNLLGYFILIYNIHYSKTCAAGVCIAAERDCAAATGRPDWAAISVSFLAAGLCGIAGVLSG